MLYFTLTPRLTRKSFSYKRIQPVLRSFLRRNWENAARLAALVISLQRRARRGPLIVIEQRMEGVLARQRIVAECPVIRLQSANFKRRFQFHRTGLLARNSF